MEIVPPGKYDDATAGFGNNRLVHIPGCVEKPAHHGSPHDIDRVIGHRSTALRYTVNNPCPDGNPYDARLAHFAGHGDHLSGHRFGIHGPIHGIEGSHICHQRPHRFG